MDQLKILADDRLIGGCVYCGGVPETREHVPSRVLLDAPFPDNLPVVGACLDCNNGFSKDEAYVACLIEAVLSGSTDPERVKRSSVAAILRRTPALRTRLDASRAELDGQVVFAVEQDRLKNVMLKLARGHALFELSRMNLPEPSSFWCLPLAVLDERHAGFDAAHVVELMGEIGSRNTQRMQAAVVTLRSESGKTAEIQLVINDWVEVQEGRYRYLAIDDVGGIRIKIVLSEYLACEAAWADEDLVAVGGRALG